MPDKSCEPDQSLGPLTEAREEHSAPYDRRARDREADARAAAINSLELFFEGVILEMKKDHTRTREFRALLLSMVDVWFPVDGETAKSVSA